MAISSDNRSTTAPTDTAADKPTDIPTSALETNTPSSALVLPKPPSPSTSTASTLPVEPTPTTTTTTSTTTDPSKPNLTKIDTSSSKPPSTHSQEHEQHIHQDVDHTTEFAGEVNTTNEPPSAEIIQKIGAYTVLDREGKSVPFRNVYSGPNVVRRVLVIFIRHFFCGNCQEYIRTLSTNPSFSPQNLLSQSPPTFICIIGCGSPSLIPMYASQTSCPYPIYTDPTKQLYTALQMIRTFSPGAKPEYVKRNMLGLAVQSVVQGVKELGMGRLIKNGEWGGGDMGQVGGEFLFESLDGGLSPGGVSPGDEEVTPNANFGQGENVKGGDYLMAGGTREDEKVVTWCHRMRNTRDHADIGTLMRVLGVSEEEEKSRKEFAERKLTGMSARSRASSLAVSQKGVDGDGVYCDIKREELR